MLLSAHHELDDLFRDKATYLEIITKPRLDNFSVLVLVINFVVQINLNIMRNPDGKTL